MLDDDKITSNNLMYLDKKVSRILKKVLDNPEFDQKDLTKRFFGLLEEDQISNILTGNEDINFYIGTPENGLEDLSIVTFRNKVNGKDMGTIRNNWTN